jgi:hypothetical protein
MGKVFEGTSGSCQQNGSGGSDSIYCEGTFDPVAPVAPPAAEPPVAEPVAAEPVSTPTDQMPSSEVPVTNGPGSAAPQSAPVGSTPQSAMLVAQTPVRKNSSVSRTTVSVVVLGPSLLLAA